MVKIRWDFSISHSAEIKNQQRKKILDSWATICPKILSKYEFFQSFCDYAHLTCATSNNYWASGSEPWKRIESLSLFVWWKLRCSGYLEYFQGACPQRILFPMGSAMQKECFMYILVLSIQCTCACISWIKISSCVWGVIWVGILHVPRSEILVRLHIYAVLADSLMFAYTLSTLFACTAHITAHLSYYFSGQLWKVTLIPWTTYHLSL